MSSLIYEIVLKSARVQECVGFTHNHILTFFIHIILKLSQHTEWYIPLYYIVYQYLIIQYIHFLFIIVFFILYKIYTMANCTILMHVVYVMHTVLVCVERKIIISSN